ncbi:uncharacterized protein G2W53_026588 [Senna tora]|uniref:Uncharacterized protein n=1 Tax=Senna tora TaxID=362788 RepID=A0A834WHK2_9FABA|nr:uncharacterized protein G2W53_026588 [Senna tora]
MVESVPLVDQIKKTEETICSLNKELESNKQTRLNYKEHSMLAIGEYVLEELSQNPTRLQQATIDCYKRTCTYGIA